MGYRVHTYSPDYDTPTGQVADVEVSASYDDLDALRAFASNVDVITFEFENVPAAAAETAAAVTEVRPSGAVLHVTQNRLREKSFLSRHGFPVTPFWPATSVDDLSRALGESGGNVIAKTAGWGYDGKGQMRLGAGDDLAAAWALLRSDEVIVEKTVDFECEVSIIVARSVAGEVATFEMTRNDHRNHILDISVAPAALPPTLRAAAIEMGESVARAIELVGLMCIEMFLTRDGKLLINELAPRPHNSGHWTFDACTTSQFEQQLRAVCALPLGATTQLAPAAMANLLGDLWSGGEPRWHEALRDPAVKLHLYGKLDPRPGRKMGHLTVLADTPDEAMQRVLAARRKLSVEG